MRHDHLSRRPIWLPIGIGALVIIIPIVYWISTEIAISRREANAVERVSVAGGVVTYDSGISKNGLLNAVFKILRVDVQRTVAAVSFATVPVKDSDLFMLRDLTGLKELDLWRTQITDEGLKIVARCYQLESLRLDETSVTDSGIREITKLHQLKELFVQHTSISDASMDDVGALRNLRNLALGETDITDVGVAKLTNLDLVELKLNGTNISDSSAAVLREFSQLRFLDLSNTNISDAMISSASRWKFIETLRISNTSISDACIEDLCQLRSLRTLMVIDTQISTEGIQAVEAGLPQCQVKH